MIGPVERVIAATDGDPESPLDGVARLDAELARRVRDAWFPRARLERFGCGAATPERVGLGPRDVIFVGGACSAAALAGEAGRAAKGVLVVHTPGSPAKRRVPEVAASYRVALGEDTEASRRKLDRMRAGLGACDALATNSRWTAGVIRAVYGPLLGERFPPVFPECVGVDAPPSPPPAREGGAGPVLLSMLRDSPRKRVEGLWAVARALDRRWGVRASWHVLAGGDRDRIAEAALREAPGYPFVVHGFVSEQEKARLFAGCDLFVHTAACEHLGASVLEAMAHARPVLVSRSGGPATYLSDGVDGALFEPDDWSRCADRAAALLADGARRRAVAEAGRALVTERFAWSAVLARLTPIFDEQGGDGSR